MTRIYFIRHCEAEGNICRRAQTIFDGLVTTKGYAQAEELRKRFHEEHIDAVYSSDSNRARATADPIAKDHGLKPRYRYALREYAVGIWDSMPNGNAERLYGDIINKNVNNLGDLWFPGGDTTDSIERRCRKVLDEIISENKDKTVVVVSHAVMTRQMLTIASMYPRSRVKDIQYGENTAVSLAEFNDDGTSRVVYMADVSHLPPKLRKLYDHDCGCINMTIDNISLPSDSEKVIEYCRKLDKSRDCRVKEDAFYLDYVKKRIEENPDYATMYALQQECKGIFLMRKDESFSDDYEVVDDYFIEEDECKKELHIQVLGHAIHVARKNCKSYVAFPKARNEWDRVILDRFEFEEIPDHPDYVRLCVLVPPCKYPVI